MTKKRLVIFSGANGSGKTTVAKYFLPILGIKEFVNADEIAFGLSPLNPTGQRVRAGKIMLERVMGLLKSGNSFSFETTFSGTA